MIKREEKSKDNWNDKKNCSEAATLCSSRTEFSKKYPAAYKNSLKNGWIDEICVHMVNNGAPSRYWNKERCRLEALKYSTRSEFCKQSNGAYMAALKKGWLDEICKHMIVKWQPKWDKESCRKEALRYNTRTEFQNHAVGAWTAASKKGWLDEICTHMEILGNLFQRCIYAFEFPDNYVYVGLTDNFRRREKQHLNEPTSPVHQHIQESNLIPIAKVLHEYTNKAIAQKLEKSVLEDYRKKGWNVLNKAKTGALGGKYLYWNKERCIEAGRKCRTKSEFIKKYSGAYASAIKNSWYDEVSAHMVPLIAQSQQWDLEKVQAEALKYNTRKEFANKCIQAYNYARKNKLLNQICSHMYHSTFKKKWTFEALQTEALKYNTRSEFGRNNTSAYSIAAKMKILDEICSHMNPVHKCSNYWTKEKCRERALLYSTKADFKREDGSAYTTAVREKWLTDICSHMVKPPVKRKWTITKLHAEAQKYETIKEFKMKSQSAYVTAGKLGILKQICSHMYKEIPR